MTNLGKVEAIRLVRDTAGSAPVVYCTGFTSRIAAALDTSSQTATRSFFMLGSMGLAGAIGQGFSAVSGSPTYVIDGDGSVLMNPTTLFPSLGQLVVPLIHVILDDGQYQSTGGQRVPQGVLPNLVAAATGFGSRDICSAESLRANLSLAIERLPVGSLLHCLVRDDLASSNLSIPRVSGAPRDIARRFSGSATWNRTEGSNLR